MSASAPTPTNERATPRRKRLGAFLLWSAGVASAIIATLVVTPLQSFFAADRMPITEQFDHLRRSQTQRDRTVTAVREVRLHPPTRSYLVLTKPRTKSTSVRRASSDTVAIYDVRNGRLQRRFEFQPGIDRGHLISHGGVLVYSFSLLSSGDLDKDGSGEIVGSWRSERYGGGSINEPFEALERPIAIMWDDAELRYVQKPLLTRRSMGTDFGEQDRGTRGRIRAYLTRVHVDGARVEQSASGFTSYGSEAVTLARDKEGMPLLLSGLIVKGSRIIIDFTAPENGGYRVRRPRTVIVDIMSLDFQAGHVAISSCPLSELGLLGPIVKTEQAVSSTLLKRAYSRYRRYVC